MIYGSFAAACIIRDTKVSVVPFNQVSADHAFKEGEDNRSLNKWREVHRRAFTPDYKAVGLELNSEEDVVAFTDDCDRCVSVKQNSGERNRCTMARQGCGAVFL